MGFCASVLDAVAGKVGEFLTEEGNSVFLVDDEAKSLHLELKMMTSFVEDMEDEVHDARTNTVVSEIRKIAYDVEDLIDYYIIEVKRSEDSQEDGIFRWSAHFFVSKTRAYKLASSIKAIRKRIDEIMKGRAKYWGENGERVEGRIEGLKRTRFRAPVTFPHDIEQHVVGLEEDINKLVGVLTTNQTQIEVVSIVGMGGSGKTTLARKLYNHESLKTQFDCLAWVSISQEWVVTKILQDLLAKVSGYTMRIDEAGLPELIERLQQYLERKRYLIVLDDVWTKKALRQILPAFPSANACRKIIVTTRKQGVVDFPDLKCSKHEPRRLNEDESWQLFRKIAFIHREESSNSADMTPFETLGREMLKKCEGLPLAVIALAGILGKKETIEEWKKVNEAVSSWIMEEGTGTSLYGPVNKMLELSYNDLQRELKPCFLHLANFLEDVEIDVKQLIRMWIAEGFITSDKLHEGDTLEDVAQRYLHELIHRCVVQIAGKNYNGMVESIRMHDLVRDLCIKKAKEQDFTEILTSGGRDSDARVIKSRRLAIYGVYNPSYNPFLTKSPPFLTKSQPLRSLVYDCRENVDLQLICQNFRLLRVLLLKENIQTSDGSVPTAIGSLIHLRYLCLTCTNISELPYSIGNLRNLQMLETSSGEVRIPDVLWKIEGLKHLDFRIAEPIEGKLKLHTLKSLQTLSLIKGGDWMLEELPLLSQTVQKLEIDKITSQEQLDAVFQCPSIKFDRLHSLNLNWNTNSGEGDGVVMLKNLEPIIHCQHLRELHLCGRIADRWGGCDIQFPNGIKELYLWNSRLEAEASLEALGKLPSLIFLWSADESYVGTKWTCFAGEFPQLKTLFVWDLQNLEEWSIERGAMPHLNKLDLRNCKKLRKLPEGLKYITGLQELQLYGTSDELKKRVKEGGEDAHIIQHVPDVHVFH